MTLGRRESQWRVLRRCLALIRRAQRGPARREDLLQAALAEAPEACDADEQARLRRLEKDLARIRDGLGVDLRYDRQAGGYIIRNAWLPLLDLPDEDLTTIAWLEQTFGYDSPQHDEVHGLLSRLRSFLAPERRGQIDRCRTTLALDLGQRDEDEIAPEVQEKLAQALGRQRIAFTYRSPQQEDGEPRRHVVDPYERYFDPVRGHYYLRGWCHYTEGPRGRRELRGYVPYRLGRISDLAVLPDRLPPAPPPAPCYAVEYELAPQIARQGVTRHPEIEIRRIERREDGSAVVHGETDNVFFAARTLLHYGPNCRVRGGPELLAEVRAVVGKMAEMYAGRDT